MYDFITIERQYGSGGQSIAKRLAEDLGYRLYDHGVVVETCKRMDVSYSYISGLEEQAPPKTLFRAPGSNLTLEEQIYRTEVEIIREAAQQPGAIFVGRCASEILKDRKVLRVFFAADDAYRLDRAVRVEKITPDQAEEEMRRNDRRRERFFNTYAEGKWGSPEYFDLLLNTSRLGADACVKLLKALVKDE